eukprot:GEMP01082100.1.p1 GENE.GEMP01082100.1~~GEMP01082100.1.p1  ORF type:complete len:191 (+),score=44.55 GEMP01082100.1:60-632(+)
MPPKTPSWAWKHMRRDFAEGSIGCLLCDRKFAAKTGTSSLACRLEGAHSLNPSTAAGSGGGEKRQQEDSDIRDAKILKKNSPDRVEQLLVLWARRGLAYDLLSDPDFKAIFGACLPSNFRRGNIPVHMAALKVKLTDDLREQIHGVRRKHDLRRLDEPWRQMGEHNGPHRDCRKHANGIPDVVPSGEIGC